MKIKSQQDFFAGLMFMVVGVAFALGAWINYTIGEGARMGLYELLTVSDGFKEKLVQAPSIDALRRQAVADGMRPLRLAGALRVAEGLTTVEEVLTATPPLDQG